MACLHFWLGARAVVQHTHAEAGRATPGQCFTNAPHADDPQGLAVHVGAEVRRPQAGLPFPRTHPTGQLHHPPRGGQEQGEAGIGGGFGEHVRGIGQHYPAPCQVRDVIVVDAHRHAGNHLQLRCQVEQFSVQAQAGAQQAMRPG